MTMRVRACAQSGGARPGRPENGGHFLSTALQMAGGHEESVATAENLSLERILDQTPSLFVHCSL